MVKSLLPSSVRVWANEGVAKLLKVRAREARSIAFMERERWGIGYWRL
jgi:hypothetical protein